MTDIHCHLKSAAQEGDLKEIVIGEAFFGTHPWYAANFDGAALRERIAANPDVGVGEIGLDRLKTKEVTPEQMRVFLAQLEIAAEFSRPVVLHGAKCWGRVFKECERFADRIPSFLFHGFSRSDGLLDDIRRINGFISVGPAVLNDHAVNYRALVKAIPSEMLLVETDRTEESAAKCPTLREIGEFTAGLRGMGAAEFWEMTDANAVRFLTGGSSKEPK